MPHLEFQTYAGQIFWLAVCFILLYAVLSAFVLPRISGVIESRGAAIAENLQIAEGLKSIAETSAVGQTLTAACRRGAKNAGFAGAGGWRRGDVWKREAGAN